MTQTQTTADNLADLVRNLGGKPRGNTVARLIDELEELVRASPEGVSEGSLTESDLDEVFGDE